MLKKYIGCKLIEAEPAYRVNGEILPSIELETDADAEVVEGYKVVYPDGYVSFSPKDVFEKAYMQVGDNISITEKNVDDFIKDKLVMTIGEKTTIVKVTLVNGFEMVESSSCVSATNYSQEIGEQICLEKIKDKIWNLLGFLLQTAVGGVKKE